MYFSIGDYAPDRPPLTKDASAYVVNAIPAEGSDWLPIPSIAYQSGVLDGRARGVQGVRRGADTYLYAGDEAKLYQFASLSWVDKSKVGGYSLAGTQQWAFAQFGDKVLATSLGAPIQEIDVNGSQFADALTSTRKPQAQQIGVVARDWVVLGNTTDVVDGAKPNRVWWLARGSYQDADPSITNQCGFEDLDPEDGDIKAVIGREYGLIVCAKAIYRMTYVGGDVQFRFDKLVKERGAIAPGTVIAFDRLVMFIDEDGPYLFDGSSAPHPIGEGLVAREMMSKIDWFGRDWISATYFPAQSVIAWGIPVVGSIIQTAYLFNWKTGRWGRMDVTVSRLFSGTTQPLYIDDAAVGDLNIDDPPQSEWNLDAPEFQGGQYVIGAFDSQNRVGFFSATGFQTAVAETPEFYLPGRRLQVNFARPVMDGANGVTVAYGARENQSDDIVWQGPVSLNAVGEALIAQQGRYARLRVNVPGGFRHLSGVEVDVRRAGRW